MSDDFRSSRFRRLVLGGWLFVAAFSGLANAQLPPTLPNPRLNWIFPAGGQVGTTIDLTVTGDDLDDAGQLYFDHPGITASLKTIEPGLGQSGRQPAFGKFQVTIPADARPGLYDLRVMGKYGLSTPRAFVVGTNPEMLEAEPNNLLSQAQSVPLGTTINGTCEPSAHDYFKFTAKKGERVLIDCAAFRIDSRVDGTLILYDSDGKELERSHNVNRRDPLIDFSVPADGEYVVSLHDHMYDYYAVAGECFYRLTISTAPYIDFVYPPSGLSGSNSTYTIYGRNLPGGVRATGIEVAGRPLEMITVNIPWPGKNEHELRRDGGLLVEPSESFLDGITYQLKSDRGLSNPVLLTTAGAPVLSEQEPNNEPTKAPLVQPPCEYVGQFYPRGDRDWVTFQARKGDIYYLEVFSQRLGLPTDPRMVIQQVKQDASGKEQIVDLQTVDDDLGNSDRVHWSMLDSVLYSTQTHDPVHRFVAPDDGTYRVMVQDLSRPSQDLARSSRGNARHVYRLSIRRPEPDFRLVAVPRPPTNLPVEHSTSQTVWSPVLQPGGATLIEVYAMRRDGFDGEIRVDANDLPSGVTAQSIVIAPKVPSATLILKAAEDAPAGIRPISIRGASTINQTEVVRQARYGAMIWAVQLTGVNYHRSRLTDRLPICVVPGDQAPYSVQVEPDVKLTASLGGTVKFPVNGLRRGSFQGPLDLFVFGLPPSIHGPMHAQPKYHLPTSLPANQNQAEFTITVPNHVPSGTYTFFLSGVGTVSYGRNPEKLKAHEDRLAAIERIVMENDLRVKAAMEAQATAAKGLVDSQANQKDVQAATEAKAAADKSLAEADQKAKQDAAFLQTFRQEVTQLREKSKPTDIKISAPTNRMTMTIVPVPFDLKLPMTGLSIKPGSKLEVPLKIERLFGSNDPVNLQFQAVFAVPGITAPIVTIPAGQSEAKLIIEALPTTKPGTYTTSINASTTYNGQALSIKPELQFVIEPAELTTK